MRRKKTLYNKNGSITISQRTKKDPITFKGKLSTPSGNVNISIITSQRGWESLLYFTRNPKEFSDAFVQDIIHPVYYDKIAVKPISKKEQINLEYNKMKLLSVLLYSYFKVSSDPIKETMLTMDKLYLCRWDVQNINQTKVIKSFKAGYLYDGEEILKDILRQNDDWLIHLLHMEYGERIRKTTAIKKDSALLLVYNLLSAVQLYLYPGMKDTTDPFYFPQYLDKRFVDIGVALKTQSFFLSNRTPA